MVELRVPTSESVILRSSDGFFFEVESEVASLSPIITDLLELNNAELEIPLPSVKAKTLSWILKLCKRYVSEKQWDIDVLRLIATNSHDLEDVASAADYLCLEELLGICLETLARLVKDGGNVSVLAMRRALRFHLSQLADDVIVAVLQSVKSNAISNDVDSLAAVRVYLRHNSPVVRQVAIEATAELSPLDDSVSIEGLFHLLNDEDTAVQIVALQALVKLTARGNERVNEIMRDKSSDGDAVTRSIAIEAIGRISKRGDPRSVALVEKTCADPSGIVRKAAIDSYVQLATKGDTRAILHVVGCLEDMEEHVRQAAVRAVGSMVQERNGDVIAALSSRLEHRYWWVAKAAARALQNIAEKDDALIIDAVMSRVAHESAFVRGVAIGILAHVASAGNSQVIVGLGSYLMHSSKGVRKDAKRLFEKLSKRNREAIKIVCSLLAHPKPKVRKVVLDVLKVITERGDAQAAKAVSRHLKHAHTEVRSLALTALLHICNRNDHAIVEALCLCVLDKDTSVQQLAASALDTLVDKGHPHAFVTLLNCLDAESDRPTLQKAVRILPRISDGSDQTISLLSSLLERQSILVRSAIFDEMMQSVSHTYHRCACASCQRWNHNAGALGRREPEPRDATMDKENVSPNIEKGATSLKKRLSRDSVDIVHDDGKCTQEIKMQPKAIKVASRALSSCLLKPSSSFPDAVACALREAGASADHVAIELTSVMSRPCWFLRWDAIESACSDALSLSDDAPSYGMSKARMQARSRLQPESTDGQASLHRPDCPFIVDMRRPEKRPRLGGA